MLLLWILRMNREKNMICVHLFCLFCVEFFLLLFLFAYDKTTSMSIHGIV